MPYATVYQVAARNAARGTYTNGTIPTASQVIEFIQESAAQLDQWLYAGGYNAPFDGAIASGIVPTSAQLLLQRWNVTGAALMVEESAQQSDRVPAYQKMWEEIKKVILDKTIDIPLPILTGKQMPRGSGLSHGTGAAQEFTFSKVPRGPGTGSWDL